MVPQLSPEGTPIDIGKVFNLCSILSIINKILYQKDIGPT